MVKSSSLVPLWGTICALPELRHLIMFCDTFAHDFGFSNSTPRLNLQICGIFSEQECFSAIYDFLEPYFPNLRGVGIGASDLSKERIVSVISQCPRLVLFLLKNNCLTADQLTELKQQFTRINFLPIMLTGSLTDEK